MIETFAQKIERFINMNSLHVSRPQIPERFSLQNYLVFETGRLSSLVFPPGMILTTNCIPGYPNTTRYFVLDLETGFYEEIIDSKIYWETYKYEMTHRRF